jgi:stage II sporulation protein D
LVFQSAVVGDGGLLARELYRSYWLPPSADDDLIRVGLIPSTKAIRFRTIGRARIKALGESSSWEVASPAEVTWKVESKGFVRPPTLAHFAVIKQKLFLRNAPHPNDEMLLWRERGFSGARWLGPPPMDTSVQPSRFERWLLSLTSATSKRHADAACAKAREQWNASCVTVSRVELPPVGRGILSSENGSFSKEFEGILELVSPYAPIIVRNFLPEERTGETSDEQFGGRLIIATNVSGTLALTQTTSFGNYLEGVVPSEIFPEGPQEALRAQAVVARTYAARYHSFENSTAPFSICASTMCQVYRGVTYRQPAPSAAVQATKNLVVRDADGDLADTFYHAICGGHTEPNQSIFGTRAVSYLAGVSDQIPGEPFPTLKSNASVSAYLEARPTSYCGVSDMTKQDRWRWKSELGEGAIAKVLKAQGLRPPLTGIAVERRGISGRVTHLRLTAGGRQKLVQGELKIRLLFGGLLSSLFVVEPVHSNGRITSVAFSGGGYGHGVGLCQMGSIGRAERGQTFTEILTSYFPGTRVVE